MLDKEIKDYPLGITCIGNLLLHEGNHDGRNNPHPQYQSPRNWMSTINVGDNLNQTVKVFEIEYKGDRNYSFEYEFEFTIKNRPNIYKLQFKLGRLEMTEFVYSKTASVYFKAYYEDLGYYDNDPNHPVGKLTMYATFSREYTVMNLRCVKAIVSRPHDGATVYTVKDDYAYDMIKLLPFSPVETNLPIFNVDSKYLNEPQFGFKTWKEFTLTPGQPYKMAMDVTNAVFGSVGSISFDIELPVGVVCSAPCLDIDNKKLSINLYNASPTEKTVPKCITLWTITAGLTNL